MLERTTKLTAPKPALPAERPGYKHTKPGWIPEEWEVLALGDAFDFRNGYNADSTAYGRGVQFANVLEVITHSELNEDLIPGRVEIGPDAHKLNSVKYGDVLFNRTSETPDEVGLTSVYTGGTTITFGGFVIRGRPTTDLFDTNYLKYGLRTPLVRKQIIAKSNGAVRSNIGQADLLQVLTLCPPLPEQRHIAQVLSAWDRAIATVQQLLAAQQERKRGLMQELLTGRRRFKGFGGKWKEVRLGFVVSKAKGSVVSSTVDPAGTPVIDAGSYEGNATLYSMSEKALRCTEKDVLLLWDGSKAGRAMTGKNGIVGSTFVLLKPKAGLDPVFLTARLTHDEVKIMAVREGSGIPHVPKDFLRWYKFDMPPIEEQRKIVEVISAMERTTTSLNDQLSTLTTQKRGLMQVLLTGEKRLNTDQNISGSENQKIRK